MLNKNSKYTLVMICLNEIDGIKYISEDVNKYLHLLNDVIFIDGGSTDGSIETAKKNGWSVFLQDKNNMGVLNGIKLGLDKCRTEYVIFFHQTIIVNQKRYQLSSLRQIRAMI